MAFTNRPDRARNATGQTYDREEVLRQCLEAWRVNPLARRVVALTTQFVLGGGVSLTCAHPATQAFLQDWWNHRLNPCRCGWWSGATS